MSPFIESKKITDLLDHVDEETLVVFDVDNTLFESSLNIGGVPWFFHLLEKLQAKGLPEKEAEKKLYQVWVQLQHVVPMKLVEPETPSVVQALHEQNIKTIGLTARGMTLAQRTHQQLEGLDIRLHQNTIHAEDLIIDEEAGFVKGVLSMEATGNKGERLIQLCEKIGYSLKRVVAIDDVPHFLEGLQNTLGKHDVPFVGIRYGGADQRLVTFDPARAYVELREVMGDSEHFKLIESAMEVGDRTSSGGRTSTGGRTS